MTTRSSRARHYAGPFVALLAFALTTTRAFADPSPADIESARALYVHGMELRDKGDLPGSLKQFRAAASLAPTAITSLEMGRALLLMGNLVEARNVFMSIERLAIRVDESQKATDARAESKSLADELRTRIPSIRVETTPQTSDEVRIFIDGAPVPPEAKDLPRKLNPGVHTVSAETHAAKATTSVNLLEGENRSVTLTLAPKLTTASPGGAQSEHSNSSKLTTDSPRNAGWLYGGLGVTGVGLVAGSVTGLLAISKTNTLADTCSGVHCPPSAADDISSAKTLGNVSTVAFAVAGAAAVTSLVLWLTQGQVTAAVPVAPASGRRAE